MDASKWIVETLDDGSMRAKDAAASPWMPARFHEDFRDEFLELASAHGEHSHEHPSGQGNNRTAFHPDHRDFGTHRDQWPDVLFQYQPTADDLNRPKPRAWIHRGSVLLDVDRKVISRYPELPLTLASNESGCFLEYLSRLNDNMSWRDIRALMPRHREGSNTIMRLGTLSRSASVFRLKNGLPGWRSRYGSDNIRNYLDIVYGPEVVRANTIKGFRPLARWELTGLELIGAGSSPEKARGQEEDQSKQDKIADLQGRQLSYSKLWHGFMRQRQQTGIEGEQDAVCQFLKEIRSRPKEIYGGIKRKRKLKQQEKNSDDQATEPRRRPGRPRRSAPTRLPRGTDTQGISPALSDASQQQHEIPDILHAQPILQSGATNNMDPRLFAGNQAMNMNDLYPQPNLPPFAHGLAPLGQAPVHPLASAPYLQSPMQPPVQHPRHVRFMQSPGPYAPPYQPAPLPYPSGDFHPQVNFARGSHSLNPTSIYPAPNIGPASNVGFSSYHAGLQAPLDFDEMERDLGDALWNPHASNQNQTLGTERIISSGTSPANSAWNPHTSYRTPALGTEGFVVSDRTSPAESVWNPYASSRSQAIGTEHIISSGTSPADSAWHPRASNQNQGLGIEGIVSDRTSPADSNGKVDDGNLATFHDQMDYYIVP